MSMEAIEPSPGDDPAAATAPCAELSRAEKLAGLADIRARSSRVSFPVDLFRDEDRVLSLFSAAFRGSNDLIHAVDAGVQAITCNDINQEGIDELRSRYGDLVQEYVVGDAFKLVDDYRAQGRSFTTLVADPYTGAVMLRLWREVERFLSIAERHAVIGICGDCLAACDTSRESLEAWLASSSLGHWRVSRQVIRNEEKSGGIYWVVLENTLVSPAG